MPLTPGPGSCSLAAQALLHPSSWCCRGSSSTGRKSRAVSARSGPRSGAGNQLSYGPSSLENIAFSGSLSNKQQILQIPSWHGPKHFLQRLVFSVRFRERLKGCSRFQESRRAQVVPCRENAQALPASHPCPPPPRGTGGSSEGTGGDVPRVAQGDGASPRPVGSPSWPRGCRLRSPEHRAGPSRDVPSRAGPYRCQSMPAGRCQPGGCRSVSRQRSGSVRAGVSVPLCAEPSRSGPCGAGGCRGDALRCGGTGAVGGGGGGPANCITGTSMPAGARGKRGKMALRARPPPRPAAPRARAPSAR